MKSSILSAAAFAALAVAVPTKNALLYVRQAVQGITDADILNYALTLEHLEDKFYREGLSNFTQSDFANAGFDATFYNNLKTVSSDETTHVSFLTAALKKAGATPVSECTYAFGVTDVKTFLATASILEGVGVTAYLGAAADIMSKTYLTAAGSILTVESRHSSYLRSNLKQSPFPSPFDVPLSLNEVFTLAAPFIKSCPSSDPKLPLKVRQTCKLYLPAFPTLTASPENPENITSGTKITLLTPGYTLKAADGHSPIFGAFITVTGPVFAEATPVDGGFSLTVPTAPEGTAPIAGQSYVVLTACNETVSDNTVAAGPAIVEIA
ncbi:MAG: hypothetical protein LQ342_006409 [Letrouitia transgressa]|nr:MAG: hypothetical protein LQ342_006409 [Letrouitia transgressa]